MAENALTKSSDPKADRLQYWLGEISAAQKREQGWRKEAKRVLKIYDAQKKDQTPFNILYSNTETLLPALYSNQPRPQVDRRFKDADPLGKLAAETGQRTLSFLCDTNTEDYAGFDSVMTDAVLDALLPGRAASRVDYDADIVGAAGARAVKWELVCFTSVKYDRWIHGYAKKWQKVPWVAFEHDVDLDEAKELFGATIANAMTFTEEQKLEDRADREDDEKTTETRKICKVWEVWVKKSKKLIWVSPNYQQDILKEEADRLELSGFYPMPEPLRFLRKSNDMRPTAIYQVYENQAKELNRISVRINRIVEAIKVRGAYDSTIAELDQVMRQDDGGMVAADNVAALQEKGGLEKAIWLMPIKDLVVALQQLIIARQQCKQVIYEITGISDILRGQTVASETATAQNIKNQWGTLRLKRLQKDVARYARDMLRIALEIAAKKFNEKTFAGITGLPFATQAEIQSANGQVAAARSMAVMQGQQVSPQLLQTAVPQAWATLQKPAWNAIIGTLKNDTQRAYRIDIETNSTVELDATEDKQQITEMLAAIGQFLQSVTPLIQTGSMPFQAAQAMLLTIVRRFRFGSDIEDYIQAMQPPTPPDDGKKEEMAAKMQMEREKHDAEMKQKAADSAYQERDRQMEFQHKERTLQLEHHYKERELAMKDREMQRKEEHAAALHQVKVAGLQAQVAAAHAMPKDKGKPNGGDRAAT